MTTNSQRVLATEKAWALGEQAAKTDGWMRPVFDDDEMKYPWTDYTMSNRTRWMDTDHFTIKYREPLMEIARQTLGVDTSLDEAVLDLYGDLANEFWEAWETEIDLFARWRKETKVKGEDAIGQRRTPKDKHGALYRLQDSYRDFQEFESFSEMYGLHTRLGFKTPREAWDVNPLVKGSVHPEEYGRVQETRSGFNLRRHLQKLAATPPKAEERNSLIDGDVSPEEYAAFWGADPVYDKPPREPGDGYLFYNFAEEGHDPEFLRKFIPAIDRTLKTLLPTDPDTEELVELRRLCQERLQGG